MTNVAISLQKILKQPEMVQSKEALVNLIEVLENKHDPEPSEVMLISELYQMFEKFSSVENIISKMVKEGMTHTGSKLDELWNNQRNEYRKFNG